MSTIIPASEAKTIFDNATQHYSYTAFIDLLNGLMSEGKTTGSNHSDEYLHYAKMNLQRMRRWDKTFELRPDVQQVIRSLPPQHWWVITEGWCGDSAQNLPVLSKMAEASEGRISLRIVLRDENPGIMDQYLTNGTARSIPILVAFDQQGNQLFKWGPRPAAAQALHTAWKANPTPVPFEDFELEMHTWYTHDKGNALQDEILQLVQR